MVEATNPDQKIVLFDGVCNICNRSVQFIITRDKKNVFQFASLQGKTGQALLQKFNKPTNQFNSFVLVEGDRIYTHSTGALRMTRHLSGAWPLLYGFIIIPPFIRNAVYNLIAKNRYRWFGRTESCWLPRPEWKAKFLD